MSLLDSFRKVDDKRFYNRFSFHAYRISADNASLSVAFDARDIQLIIETAKKLQRSADVGLHELRGMNVSPLVKIAQSDFVSALELTKEAAKFLIKAGHADQHGQNDECKKYLAQWIVNIDKATEIINAVQGLLKSYQTGIPKAKVAS